MPEHSAPLPSTSRVRRIIDLIGFLVGIGLLTWLIVIAVRDGDWQRVMEADRRLLVGLVGCTVLSAALTGATFWVTVRPVKRLGFMELQGVNLVASMLNYAPVRLGMLSRFAWHMRVDAMRLLDILAWFASVAVLIAAGLVICSVATILMPGVGAFWWILILLGTLGAGLVLGLVPRIPFVQKHGRGADQILASGSARWGGLVLRLLDFGTFAGRVAFALAILGITMAPSHVLVLAVVALLANLIPFGRLGFREFAVAWAASRLGSDSVTGVNWEQLALVESGGEVLVFLPLGLLCSPWFAMRLRRGAAGRSIGV
ncbi:MAG: hypothetical protein P8K80_02830 [Phycisphaerales bacterium]|nr:hypothetical protein [Phycisphaerales bacterium]